MSTFTFRPAREHTDRHGCFVALVGGTNSGKTVSGLRLARGIAGPKGKIAVLDTEGGRTLHLKDAFDFDVMVMAPPHRPERYLQAAEDAQTAGYDCLLIDSFTNAWRGIGGTLDWQDEELELLVKRARSNAKRFNRSFDEGYSRQANKVAASIRPKMAWKRMVFGFLGLRMPVIFSIRGENTYDPDKKEEVFKAQVQRNFAFEVTVSFRLAADRKGIIDLSDPKAWKMEGAHRDIFRDGQQLSEEHGAALAAWARGEVAKQATARPLATDQTPNPGKMIDDQQDQQQDPTPRQEQQRRDDPPQQQGNADPSPGLPLDEKPQPYLIDDKDRRRVAGNIDRWTEGWEKAIQAGQRRKDAVALKGLREKNRAPFDELAKTWPDEVADIRRILDAAIGSLEGTQAAA